MKTNYQRFLDGEYCNRLDPEVLEMMVQTKRLLARFHATDIADWGKTCRHPASDAGQYRQTFQH